MQTVTALVGVPAADVRFLVTLENRQLSWSELYASPFWWQQTRLLSCRASPAARRSLACRCLWAVSAAIARLGSSSERLALPGASGRPSSRRCSTPAFGLRPHV